MMPYSSHPNGKMDPKIPEAFSTVLRNLPRQNFRPEQFFGFFSPFAAFCLLPFAFMP
jgi:hypothetical protein